MQDVIELCENCEQNPSISTTDDDVELCAKCELALIDEMARHEDDCSCSKAEEVTGWPCAINCDECTCGALGRVERRKLWLRSEVAKNPAHEWEPDFSHGEPPTDSKTCGICGREHATR